MSVYASVHFTYIMLMNDIEKLNFSGQNEVDSKHNGKQFAQNLREENNKSLLYSDMVFPVTPCCHQQNNLHQETFHFDYMA